MTLKELTIAYDAHLLSEWDQTSIIAAGIHNLTVAVINMVSKSKVRSRPPSYFHPYRETAKTGVGITQDNFGLLRSIGNALCNR
jgi:hypothetical protein